MNFVALCEDANYPDDSVAQLTRCDVYHDISLYLHHSLDFSLRPTPDYGNSGGHCWVFGNYSTYRL